MGAAAIFGGNYVKTLKDKLNLFDKAYVVTGTADPTTVATLAPKGSIYMRQSTPGALYVKLDDGLTTNWSPIDQSFPTSFTMANNQSSAADITGLIADSTNGIGFNLEYGIRRAIPAGEDTSFYTALGTALGSDVTSIAIQSDGKMVIGGNFTTFNGNTRNRLIRLNSNGTEDTAFYTALGTGFGGNVNRVIVQSDGKILVAGAFTTLNGNTRNRIVRLNSDGTEDSTFITNMGTAFTGFSGEVVGLGIQSDGKILAGGDFTQYNGNSRRFATRINADGTDDSTWNSGHGTVDGSYARGFGFLSGGECIMVGGFTLIGANTRNRIMKFSTAGVEDATFITNMGTAFNNIAQCVAIDTSNQILVGGDFTQYNGNTRNSLVRLSSSGVDDTAFATNLGTGFNGAVRSIALQSDGKMVIGGFFTTLNGNTRNRIVRLNSDGTEDTAFYTALGTGFGNGSVGALAIQSDTKVLIGGSFTLLGGNTRNRLIRFAPASELTKQGSLRGLYRASASTWELGGEVSIGDDPGVTLSILSSGQLQYTTTNITGSTNTFKYRMIKT